MGTVGGQGRGPYGADSPGEWWEAYAGDYIDGEPEFVDLPEEAQNKGSGWSSIDLADHFDLLTIDFQRCYGIDLDGSVRTPNGWEPIMRARTARWFRWRVHGLTGLDDSRFSWFVARRRNAPAPDELEDDTVEVLA